MSLSIALSQNLHGVFSSTQALLENRGACVSTHFWQVANSRLDDPPREGLTTRKAIRRKATPREGGSCKQATRQDSNPGRLGDPGKATTRQGGNPGRRNPGK